MLGWGVGGGNMSTMGRVAVLEPPSHDGGACRFVGGTAFRCSWWNWSKGSQVSHGKRQTRRFDKSVTLWWFPLAGWLSLGGLGLLWIHYVVPSVDVEDDLWLLWPWGCTDIRWERKVHSPSSHHPSEILLLNIKASLNKCTCGSFGTYCICSFP